MRLRLFSIACALVLLAFAGLHHGADRPAEPSGRFNPTDRVSAQLAPEPALPVVVNEATTVSPTAPTPLTSGWHRHLQPASPITFVRPLVAHTATDAARPLTFPLLI